MAHNIRHRRLHGDVEEQVLLMMLGQMASVKALMAACPGPHHSKPWHACRCHDKQVARC